MGQKVHPFGIRLGIIFNSNSCWYVRKCEFSKILRQDIEIRLFIRSVFSISAAISNVFIERAGDSIKITLRTAKPGLVIGKKGVDIDKLRVQLAFKYKKIVVLNIEEIKKPDLESVLVAENIATQLEKRIAFRRAIKRAISSAIRQNAKGIKISVAGRLGGAEIARTEWFKEGKIPLHTFRANIDYGVAEAKTTYGIIGVKVWIFKGEIFLKNRGKEREVY